MMPRGLGTLLVTPFIGRVVARFDPRKPMALGFLLGAWTLYRLGTLNLNAGYWDFFWPQLVQGMAFGMLFVPLTTVTMNVLRNDQIGGATSLFNLVRNIGGSAGIAMMQTMLQRNQAAHVNALSAHISLYDPQAYAALQSLERMFIATGSDAVTAGTRAYAVLYRLVQQQAAILSFLDAFRMLAIAFAIVAPLAFVMKRPAPTQRSAAASHE
jgi:DHA2 family multidrug resistance protein